MATLIHTTVSGNLATSQGGGIEKQRGTATLTHTSVLDSSAFRGGGNLNSGTLTLTSVKVSDNGVDDGGGGGTELRVYQRGADTMLRGDINGDAVWDFEIQVNDTTAADLTEENFVLA